MFLLTVFQKKKKTKDKQMMEKILKINNLKLTKKIVNWLYSNSEPIMIVYARQVVQLFRSHKP